MKRRTTESDMVARFGAACVDAGVDTDDFVDFACVSVPELCLWRSEVTRLAPVDAVALYLRDQAGELSLDCETAAEHDARMAAEDAAARTSRKASQSRRQALLSTTSMSFDKRTGPNGGRRLNFGRFIGDGKVREPRNVLYVSQPHPGYGTGAS